MNTIMKLALGSLALLSLQEPLLASERLCPTVRPQYNIVELQHFKGLHKSIHVTLKVFEVQFNDTVIYGTTPADLLENHYHVVRGLVCCHPREVKQVENLATDPYHNKYWVLTVNGSKQLASPHASILEEGDIVEWTYTDKLEHREWKYLTKIDSH